MTRQPGLGQGRLGLRHPLVARAVLLDEPFSRLDAALRERFRRFVFEHIAAQGIPAVLVTHDLHDVPPGAERIELSPEPDDA
jgi:putative thiamine transport system ATP-binding protein